MKIRTPQILGALLVAGLTFGLAAPAFAQASTTRGPNDATETDIENGKDRCIQAITERLDTLAVAQNRLDEADFVTDAHSSALTTIISDTTAGLRNLSEQIKDSQVPDEVRAMCKSIAPDYRVYLVVVPQVRLTAAADKITATEARVDELVAKFDEAVVRAEEAGADVAEAVALRDRAVEQFGSAWVMVDGVADSALSVTPVSFNEGPGAVTLDNARESTRSSAEQLRIARDTGMAAVQALKDAIAAV